MTFTPAPWRIEPHAKFGSTHMYWVNDFTSVGSEVEDDVRLIAAAPELYEALEEARAEVVRLIKRYGAAHSSVVLFHMDAALAKARGEQVKQGEDQ